MRFSGVSALAIWNSATRTLSSLGATTIVSVTVNHAVLANGTSVDLRPAAGALRHHTICGEPLANVTWTVQTFDGTTARNNFTAAAGTGFAQVMTSTITLGASLANAGTVSGNYNVLGWDWKQ